MEVRLGVFRRRRAWVGRVFATAKTAGNLPSQISGFAGALFRDKREITVEIGSLRRRCLLGEN